MPQLLVNSIVKVVPDTTLERILKKKGRLQELAYMREWIFLDKEVAWIYKELDHDQYRTSLNEAISNRDTNKMTKVLAQTKIEELKFLCERLNISI